MEPETHEENDVPDQEGRKGPIFEPLEHVPVEVVDMADRYGPGQRGSLARQVYAQGDLIQVEVAQQWVAVPQQRSGEHVDDNDDGWTYFERRPDGTPHPVCPSELLPLQGGLLVALTALLMHAKHERLVQVMLAEGGRPVEWALHGQLHSGRYMHPAEAYEWVMKLWPWLDCAPCPASERPAGSAEQRDGVSKEDGEKGGAEEAGQHA